MERRAFIRTSCFTCAGTLGVAWLLQACSTNKYITDFTFSQNKITLKKSEFNVLKNGETTQKKFILIQPANLHYPIALYRTKESNYKALLLQCTHQNCELNPYETAMVCPCHGSEFNTKGEVTQGPATTVCSLL